MKVEAFVTATTQRSPAGSITLHQNVSDTVTLSGSLSGQLPAGTVQFYTCAAIMTTVSFYPTCQHPSDGTALGGPVTVSGSGSTGTASSISFAAVSAGQYCFLAAYTSNTIAYNGMTDNITTANRAAECFSVQNPSAFTLSSMSAQSVDSGMGWAMLGLGTLGSVTLGALLFIIARKR